MPINAGYEYENAEKEYLDAKSIPDKLKCLQRMLSVAPSHKGAEKLRNDIKQRISKYKGLLEREKKLAKKGGKGFSIKKEGAARVVLIGVTNSGKSILLGKITNAKPKIADYEYTTKKPEIGTMDYKGVIIQVIEIPAIIKNYLDKEKGPTYMGIIRDSDLIVLVSRDKEDVKLVKSELKDAGIRFNGLLVSSKEDIKEMIWEKLGLIYVYTKSPGRDKDYPPVALKDGSNVRDLASTVHKDFIKRFDYANIWGESIKHQGMRCGLKHILSEGDIVELHLR